MYPDFSHVAAQAVPHLPAFGGGLPPQPQLPPQAFGGDPRLTGIANALTHGNAPAAAARWAVLRALQAGVPLDHPILQHPAFQHPLSGLEG